MAVETERKFLVTGESWRCSVTRSIHVREGLVARSDGVKVRVRIAETRASITVKTARVGMTRAEFEYEIPLADAKEMLGTVCHRSLEKIRHFVTHGAATWTIDEYAGLLDGVILAEIELATERQALTLPDWAGAEVTNDPRYRKANLVLARISPEAGEQGRA